MAHNPVRVYRAFTLGGTQFGEPFFIGFCRICGMVFRNHVLGRVLLQATLVVYALTR